MTASAVLNHRAGISVMLLTQHHSYTPERSSLECCWSLPQLAFELCSFTGRAVIRGAAWIVV